MYQKGRSERMQSFKELVQQDRSIFLNLEEFGEPHQIDGTEMTVLIDKLELIEREKKERTYEDGIYQENILIYVFQEEFGELPCVDDIIVVDGKRYLVKDAVNEDGIFSISLEANVS